MTCVIKIGGSLLDDPDSICRDIAARSKEDPTVIVHGGGGRVSELSRRLGLTPRFEEGLRVTDDATLQIVLMVLAGQVNKTLVAALARAGARPVGITGGDAGIAIAEPIRPALGHVGRIRRVNAAPLETLLEAGFLPVVASVALTAEGAWLNVNADPMAAAIAAAIGASRLVFLTDVPGVLGEDGALMPHVRASAATSLIERGVVKGGMRPKLEACGEALGHGVREVLVGGTRLTP